MIILVAVLFELASAASDEEILKTVSISCIRHVHHYIANKKFQQLIYSN